MDIKQLAEQFLELITERDCEVDYYGGYNERCYEIDDKLIPQIISQIPSGMMGEFNQLANRTVFD